MIRSLDQRGDLTIEGLVAKAQEGCEVSRNRLAEQFEGRLSQYVYRLTLNPDITEDIVQETILDMFKELGKLRKRELFWPWMRRIAFNKVYTAHREREREIGLFQRISLTKPHEESKGLAKLIGEELQQIVVRAMEAIKPEHRQLLTLRVYEEMKFEEIANLQKKQEFAVRMQFWRAKRSLAKQLARAGLGKGALMTALVIFGKVTGTSKAQVTGTTIAAGSLKVGTAAAVGGALGTVGGLLTTVAVVGTIVLGGSLVQQFRTTNRQTEHALRHIPVVDSRWHMDSKSVREVWYYYPYGSQGVVMTKGTIAGEGEESGICQWIQNVGMNRYFDQSKNTVYIQNSHRWNRDLSVLRLPTDEPALKQFIDRVEGRPSQLGGILADGQGLLLKVIYDDNGQVEDTQVDYNSQVPREEFFQNPWPADVKVVDERDAMHRRGWTYFRIAGEIRGQKVKGKGRIAFTERAFYEHLPWFYLQVGNQEYVQRAYADRQGRIRLEPNGSFFSGLSRPWLGLNTLDLIRRDAAKEKMYFSPPEILREHEISLILTRGNQKLMYSIDIVTDVVRKITMYDSREQKVGELYIDYIQDLSRISEGDFLPQPSTQSWKNDTGISWFFDLGTGN